MSTRNVDRGDPSQLDLISTDMLLSGKTALVTGAGRGIGREIALALARNGASVCLSARTSRDIESVSEAILKESSGGKAFSLAGDVSRKEDADQIVRRANELMGSVDILIAAAGFPLMDEIWEKSLHELSEEELITVFKVDVLGSFNAAKNVIPLMIKNGGGSIVLFSSTPAVGGYNKGAPYTVAKAANLGLMKDIASEYGKYNIRCNAVAPGNIKTDKTFDRLLDSEKQLLAEESSMKRWGNPVEVANVVCVLASDRMSFVTGQTIIVDGGTVMF